MRFLVAFFTLLFLLSNSYAFETQSMPLLWILKLVTFYLKKFTNENDSSSMSKLMTVYLVFERLKKNILNLDDKFTVSEKAWRKGGSKMFLRYR